MNFVLKTKRLEENVLISTEDEKRTPSDSVEEKHRKPCLSYISNLHSCCRMVWCDVVCCGVVWCGVVWCGVVWCSTVSRACLSSQTYTAVVVLCGVVWCGVVWCGMV